MSTDAVADLAAEIDVAETAVALTGAGLSTASGIPDFRSEGGLWDRFDKRDYVYSRFQADPAGFWADRIELQDALFGDEVGPNEAHDALATLEHRRHLDAVLTQNVDGLHEAAGSETVLQLHGTAQRVACQSCGNREEADPVHERAREGELPPTCGDCGGIYKPDVVLFGEQLPQATLQRARRLAGDADVFLAVGSSVTVEPVASLPAVARRSGGTLAVCNLDRTPVSETADYDLRADVTDVLPALVDELDPP
jgi:NAD-dependent deacetylase